MPDIFYPSVDIAFVQEHVLATGKLEEDGIVKVGSTTTFVIQGPQAIYKRTISVREIEPGQICFEQATALALRFSFMGLLLEWYVTNRDWKEGGYIVKPEKIEPSEAVVQKN